MKLKCNHEKCIRANGGKPYEWEYKGNLLWATCPSCRLKVKRPVIDKQNQPLPRGEIT